MTYNVFSGTLNPSQSINQSINHPDSRVLEMMEKPFSPAVGRLQRSLNPQLGGLNAPPKKPIPILAL